MSHTLVSLWTDVRKRLEGVGVDTPVLDARILLEAGAGVSRLDIITDPRRPMSDAQVEAVEKLASRRERREPIAYILGRKSFWTLDLIVGEGVLAPRPETEVLVEAALACIPVDAPARIIDLGVGSGAILLAILSERPNATGVGVDASAAALAVAETNARSLGLERRVYLRQGDWWGGVEEDFDMVVSNPPYIPHDDIPSLPPEISKHEPLMALDGGADGLDCYRDIIQGLPSRLRPNGVFALEVGKGQDAAVSAICRGAGLSVDPPLFDLAGVKRVVKGRLPD